jgi:hypothetical protein
MTRHNGKLLPGENLVKEGWEPLCAFDWPRRSLVVNDYRKYYTQMVLERELRVKPIWLEIERLPLPVCLKFRRFCSADAGKRVPNQHIQHPQPADVGAQEDHSRWVRLNRAYNHSLVPKRMSTHGCERRFCHLWGNDSQ